MNGGGGSQGTDMEADNRVDEYLAQNRDAIERAVAAAMTQAVKEQADDPIRRIGQILLESSTRSRRHTYESVYGEMEASNAASAAAAAARQQRLNKYSSLPAVVRARVRTARRGVPYTNFRRMENAACLMELMHRVEERSATKLQRQWRWRSAGIAAATSDSVAAVVDLDGDGEPDDDWTAASWLKEQGVTEALAAAIIGGPWPPNGNSPLAPRRSTSSQRAARSKSELSRLRSLGAAGRESLLYALRTNNALDKIADMLAPALASLAHTDSATAGELHGKFVEAGGFEIEFGTLATFFGGLESVVGSPSPRVRAEMEAEHCARADSAAPFIVDNYLITTCSRIEWCFVVDAGDKGLARLRADADLDGKFDLDSGYPDEKATLPAGARPRTSLPLDEFAAPLETHNARLRSLSQPEVIKDEAIAVRLYTGPMFLKYNGVLRGLQSKLPFFVQRFERLCRGNRYTTTLHALNSAIIKLSKLTVACNVYRGVSGGSLPAALRQRNEYGVRGGVDLAFMSASTDRSVALHYAGSGGGPAVALELQQGLVSRGADVWWLSQFPHEREVLFAPLTACEVRSLRAEGAVLVAEIALALNLGAATLEQVIAKRRKMLVDMGDMCGLEVGTALQGAGADDSVRAAAADALRRRLYDETNSALAHDVDWYNNDESFVEGGTAVVDAKNLALCIGRRAAGASAAALLAEGFTSRQLRAAGCGVFDFKVAGLSLITIAALGFSMAELAEGGIDSIVELSRLTIDEIQEGEYSAEALRQAGWSSHDLLSAGFTISELHEAGYVPMDLRAHGATVKDLKGANVLALHAAGYTPADFKQAHMLNPSLMLMNGCYTKAEIRPFLYSDGQMPRMAEQRAMHIQHSLRQEKERQLAEMHKFGRGQPPSRGPSSKGPSREPSSKGVSREPSREH